MKINKFFFRFIVIGLLHSTVNTYAYSSSYFNFVFKNETNRNIVTVKKITDPSESDLKKTIGPIDMQPNNKREFLLLQDWENYFDKTPPRFAIKMSWLLTVMDKKRKIICQNKVLGWVKGHGTYNMFGFSTAKWRYNITSIQNSPDVKMCPFRGMFPKYLPSSYKKDGYKCYPLVIRIKKGNSLTVD